MRRAVLILTGLMAVIFGLVFMLQGLGMVRVPSESFMIDSRTWVVRGGILAALGAILIGGARLMPRSRRRD